MHVYCLFCQTQRCGAIAAYLRAIVGCEVIKPRVVQRKWVKGEAQSEEHDYLPGYLFLYAEQELTSFEELLRIDGVIRCLGYRDVDGLFHFSDLVGDDLRFASMLHDCGGVIDTVKVYKEGDRLTPAGGLLANLEGRIMKVDRHRQRLLMEFNFDGNVRQLWVGFDVVEAKEQADTADGAQ